MKYAFPVITNINQVLPLIVGKPEFVVAVKDGGYTVVNYVVMANDTFPPVVTEGDAILRELRGLVFNTETGAVIARRLHKFFNAGEREETHLQHIDFAESHVILEKLDGSMITPLHLPDGSIRWGTKMGVTDVAKPVEEFVANNPQYREFALECQAGNMTPIFEWCSRKQRIVIDYPVDQLVLIAIRNNESGEYYLYHNMCEVAARRDIPVVQAYKGTAANMEALVAETRDLKGAEGFVVRFNTGHMTKVKAEEYLQLHRVKDAIQREKNVIEILVTEMADDIKAFMDATDLARFEEFENKFWFGVRNTALDLNAIYGAAHTLGITRDRKQFAVDFVQQQPDKYHRFLYKMRPHCDTFSMVKETIAASCSTQSKVEAVRWMFDCNWDEAPTE